MCPKGSAGPNAGTGEWMRGSLGEALPPASCPGTAASHSGLGSKAHGGALPSPEIRLRFLAGTDEASPALGAEAEEIKQNVCRLNQEVQPGAPAAGAGGERWALQGWLSRGSHPPGPTGTNRPGLPPPERGSLHAAAWGILQEVK